MRCPERMQIQLVVVLIHEGASDLKSAWLIIGRGRFDICVWTDCWTHAQIVVLVLESLLVEHTTRNKTILNWNISKFERWPVNGHSISRISWVSWVYTAHFRMSLYLLPLNGVIRSINIMITSDNLNFAVSLWRDASIFPRTLLQKISILLVVLLQNLI